MINGGFFMPRNPRDFNQIPRKFEQLRPGDSVSFKVPEEPLIEIPGEICDDALEIPNPINLLPDRRGRKLGTTIIYTPDQTYNYLSVSERDDRSLPLLPAYVREEPEETRIVYGFCSSNSPNGFWEVVISTGGNATFIEFDPPFLTILCPKPFKVSDLTTLNSDSTSYKWTQISGSRTVIITPDDVKDPQIDILTNCIDGTGCNQNSQQPIRIRVETDNPLIFTDLIILNRATDNFDGLGYSFIPFSQVECRRITNVYRVPNFAQNVFLWTGTSITVTWTDPTCDAEFITQFKVEVLIPPYAVVDTIPYSRYRQYTLFPNEQYRLLAEFNIYGNSTISISEPLIFRYDATDPVKQLFADDSVSVLGYVVGESTANTDVPGVQVRNLIDDFGSMLGFASGDSAYSIDVPGAQVRLLSEDIAGVLGYTNADSTYVITDLGGIVVG